MRPVEATGRTIIEDGRGGSIVLIGSASGVVMQPFMVHYTAGEHAITRMARALAGERRIRFVTASSVSADLGDAQYRPSPTNLPRTVESPGGQRYSAPIPRRVFMTCV